MTWLASSVMLLVLVLSHAPAFGQTATTTATSTPAWSTPEEYREYVIRCAVLDPVEIHFRCGATGELPAVEDISDTRFGWISWEHIPGYSLSIGGSLYYACSTKPPFGTNMWPELRLSCAQLRLPPTGATLTYSELPEGYSQYGEPPPPTPPPTARRPTTPTTPEPEPETTQEPVGNLEVPSDGSFQSGIGYVSGWVCDGRNVEIVIDGGLHLPPVARNIGRGDTEAVCGDRDNGFITQWNWNLMGDGTYTAALVVDGKTLQENRFTVTTLGEEFIRGLERDVVVNDFPSAGETARFRWQEPVQGLVLVPGSTD